jgi:hypothetical protein
MLPENARNFAQILKNTNRNSSHADIIGFVEQNTGFKKREFSFKNLWRWIKLAKETPK